MTIKFVFESDLENIPSNCHECPFNDGIATGVTCSLPHGYKGHMPITLAKYNKKRHKNCPLVQD